MAAISRKQKAGVLMMKEIRRAVVVVLVGLLALATAGVAKVPAQAAEPNTAKVSLPEAPKDEDEFYVHVDKVISPTELMVTVLDVWQPMDRLRGPRWPQGKAKVQPTTRKIILEETSVPDNAEQKKAALDFIIKTIKESGDELITSGSNIATKKESGREVICITAYVYVKAGFTLNNALVRRGLATTTNPLYFSWQNEAKQKKLGIWRDQK